MPLAPFASGAPDHVQDTIVAAICTLVEGIRDGGARETQDEWIKHPWGARLTKWMDELDALLGNSVAASVQPAVKTRLLEKHSENGNLKSEDIAKVAELIVGMDETALEAAAGTDVLPVPFDRKQNAMMVMTCAAQTFIKLAPRVARSERGLAALLFCLEYGDARCGYASAMATEALLRSGSTDALMYAVEYMRNAQWDGSLAPGRGRMF